MSTYKKFRFLSAMTAVVFAGTCVPQSFAHQVVLRNFKMEKGSKMVIMQGSGGGETASSGGQIGTSGAEGFGVGVCPAADLPTGFTGVDGYTDSSDDDYGNYTYTDGSVMVFIPKFYYKVGTGSNGLAVNVIDVKGTDTYATTAAANAAGYALHRAFIDGGEEKSGFFIDKYKCSNNGGTASSIKNGDPISTHAAHNPIAGLDDCSNNVYWEAINAAQGRHAMFNVASRFMYSALAMLSMAHGQAASGTDYCAWYDAGGTTNYPKGCNDNSLGDTDDATVSYTSDGYSNCGKTGSGTPFAKTTHNGQTCGVADINGLMWELSLGLTRPGANATDTTNQNDASAFYILKESVALKDLTSGWSNVDGVDGYEAWGTADHLQHLYDAITISHIDNSATVHRFGSGTNQVLSEATSGDNWLYTGLGIPKDNNANDASGTALFGTDYFYEYHRANLAVLSCGPWLSSTIAGAWTVLFSNSRSFSNGIVGFRAACYPV
jgi:hypothetical protein